MDEAHVQRVDDECEAVDAGLVRLQVAHAGRPLDVGHQVEVGVFSQRRARIGPQRHQYRLQRGGRPLTQVAAAIQRRHHGDGNGRAALPQVVQIGFAGVFDDHRLVFQLGGGVAADRADIAGDDVGPLETRCRAGLARLASLWRDAPERRGFQLAQRRTDGLIQRPLAADARKIGQGEVDLRVGVADLGGMAAEALGQPAMVEAGNQQDLFLGEDARLGAVGQNHTPALDAGANAAAIDHRRLSGSFSQR